MLQGFHHRLLFSGLLLLAGAAGAALWISNEVAPAAISRATRPAPAVVRSSRAGAEHSSSVSSSAAVAGSVSPVVGGHDDDAPAPLSSGLSSRPVTALHVSDPGLPEVESAGGELPVRQAGSVDSGLVSAPAFTPEVSFSNDHAWITNDPSAPGSSLSLDSQTAVVTAAQPVPGSRGVALGIVVEDMPPDAVAVPDFSPVPGQEPAGTTDLSTPGPIARRSGFTHQQELFRTKWGWAAYDQVQKILREETSD